VPLSSILLHHNVRRVASSVRSRGVELRNRAASANGWPLDRKLWASAFVVLLAELSASSTLMLLLSEEVSGEWVGR
jgi:hypothetical protein